MIFYINNGLLTGAEFCGEQVIIPDSVTHIGNSAFHNCAQMKSLSLPESLISIGDRAFPDCRSLQTLSFPASVRYIGYCAFTRCEKLHSVRLHPPHFTAGPTMDALLDSVKVILCTAPLDEIPEKYRLKACIGFALQEAEYGEEASKSYFDYIRRNADELSEAALDFPELLRLMCREVLIDTLSFPALLFEAIRREGVEPIALLLKYARTHLLGGKLESSDDFSL